MPGKFDVETQQKFIDAHEDLRNSLGPDEAVVYVDARPNSDPPVQARGTLAAARTALRAPNGVRTRPAEPARRDRPGDRTDPHHGR